jgi:hemerythrin-like metal-binding protein
VLDIIWDETYSVRIAEIDLQHQKFTALLDMLFEAIEAGRAKSALSGILRELVAYAVYHFDTEERLMIKYRYPELGAHQKEHEEFRAKMLAFQRNFAEGKETLSGDLVKFMTHWIADHVMNSDKKYGPFLNACGVF